MRRQNSLNTNGKIVGFKQRNTAGARIVRNKCGIQMPHIMTKNCSDIWATLKLTIMKAIKPKMSTKLTRKVKSSTFASPVLKLFEEQRLIDVGSSTLYLLGKEVFEGLGCFFKLDNWFKESLMPAIKWIIPVTITSWRKNLKKKA